MVRVDTKRERDVSFSFFVSQSKKSFEATVTVFEIVSHVCSFESLFSFASFFPGLPDTGKVFFLVDLFDPRPLQGDKSVVMFM